MQPLVVAMPRRSDLLIPFKNDEVQAGLSKTCSDRKSCGTCPDDGNVCMLWHLLGPLFRYDQSHLCLAIRPAHGTNAGADDACQVRADERAPADPAGDNACAVRSPTLPVRGHADDVHHECEDVNDPLAHERDCDGGAP